MASSNITSEKETPITNPNHDPEALSDHPQPPENSHSAKPSSSPTEAKPSPTPNEPELTDQTNFLPPRQILISFLGLAAALGCVFLDQSIVSTALPNISSELYGGRDSSWVATAYFLTSLAFTPLYGRWSDIFGRKTILVVSLAIFWVFSLACALSQTMIQLIVFRALKGIGGGALMTMVFIIVADIVPLADRGKYQSLTEIVSACCNLVGPILGGVFSQSTTWRWCFWINLPLCGIGIVTTLWLIPFKPVGGNLKEKFLKIDYFGSASAILGSTLLLLGLTWGGVTYPWVSAPVLVPLVTSFAIFTAFLLWEAKWAKLPIVPIHVFRSLTLIGNFIATAVSFMNLFINIFYMPQLLQLLRNTTPIHAGIIMLSFLLVIPIFVMLHGFMVARTGRYKPSIVSGFALWTVAQGLATTIDIKSSDGKIAGILVMAAVGSGGTFQTLLIAAHASVPRSEMAVTTGVRTFFRLLASAVGLAVSASIINNTLHSTMQSLNFSPSQISLVLDDPTSINNPQTIDLTSTQREAVLKAYTAGFQRVLYMTTAFCAVATISSLLLIKEFSLEREEDEEIKRSVRDQLREKKAERKNKKDGEKNREVEKV